jgi:hypothetical protein
LLVSSSNSAKGNELAKRLCDLMKMVWVFLKFQL